MPSKRSKKRRRAGDSESPRPKHSTASTDDYSLRVGDVLPATKYQLKGISEEQKIQALKLLDSAGMVVLGPATLPLDFIKILRQSAADIASEVEDALQRRGVAYRMPAASTESVESKNTSSASAKIFERRNSFRFTEVASRCLGRLDIRHRLDETPFSDQLLTHNPIWYPIVKATLGHDVELGYAGIVLSLPGSAVQAWHVDGSHLFGYRLQCPPHCLDVFVPLMDMTPELGPTEFVPSSHKVDKAAQFDKLLKTGGSTQDDVPDGSSCAPLLSAGSAVLYDHRLVHRGTANITKDTPRPMLYLMYTKPWFKEHMNFDMENSLFSAPTENTQVAAHRRTVSNASNRENTGDVSTGGQVSRPGRLSPSLSNSLFGGQPSRSGQVRAGPLANLFA